MNKKQLERKYWNLIWTCIPIIIFVVGMLFAYLIFDYQNQKLQEQNLKLIKPLADKYCTQQKYGVYRCSKWSDLICDENNECIEKCIGEWLPTGEGNYNYTSSIVKDGIFNCVAEPIPILCIEEDNSLAGLSSNLPKCKDSTSDDLYYEQKSKPFSVEVLI